VASFLGHAEEKRWNRTLFQVYLNNKPRYGYTLWTLDEPFEYLDWAALRTFARLTREGLSLPEAYSAERLRAIVDRSVPELPGGEPVVLFRADVSRPMWMGSLGDGLFNALYVSSDTLPMRRLLRGLEESIPALLFAYGTPPPVTAGGWSPVAWCLEAWSAHAEGVLPWQSLAGEEALWRPVDTGLLIDGGRYGRAVASLRLHALRRGAQDVELLRLLERRNGWTREQSAYLVALALGRGDPLPPEPAWRESETLRAADFLLLKEAVLQLLAPQPVSPP
jgi:hypothetical protein